MLEGRRTLERGRSTAYAATYRTFFLWRFFRRRFLRLWVAILWRFRFLPQGMFVRCYWFFSSIRKRSTPLMMAVSCVNVLYFVKHAIA